jgi:hypothetical protein
MTSSRISLAALVAVALIACGGGGQGEGSGSPQDGVPGPEQPGYNDQAPPSNPNAPANSYDPVPTSDDQPGSTPGTPGGGGGAPLPGNAGAICTRICNGLAAKQCDVGGSPSTCAAECAAEIETEIGQCVNQFGAFYDCLLASPSFVCVANEDGTPGDPNFDDEDVLTDCEAEVLDYVNCVDDEPEPGGECSAADQCMGCVDVCDACLCALDDEELCASSCGQ